MLGGWARVIKLCWTFCRLSYFCIIRAEQSISHTKCEHCLCLQCLLSTTDPEQFSHRALFTLHWRHYHTCSVCTGNSVKAEAPAYLPHYPLHLARGVPEEWMNPCAAEWHSQESCVPRTVNSLRPRDSWVRCRVWQGTWRIGQRKVGGNFQSMRGKSEYIFLERVVSFLVSEGSCEFSLAA